MKIEIEKRLEEAEKNQLAKIEKMFEDQNRMIEQKRKEYKQEINLFVKEYFQEWLDINALIQFKR